MPQSLNTDTAPSRALGTSSARLVAIRLKSANKNIFRAMLSLSSANLLIRLMGLINAIIVTARFGQGPAMDAYFIATTVPILMAQLLGSSIEGSFVPVYAGMRAKGGKEKASRLFSTVLNLLFISSGLLTLGMIFFREQLLHISAPGASAQVLAQTVALAPLVFPLLSVMILNSYMESLLNAEGKFGWAAYSGLLVPLTTAVFILLLGGKDGVFAIGLGTLVGQCIQSCFFITRAWNAKIKYRFILDLGTPEMKDIAVRAWPSLLAGVIALASPLIDQIFASYQTRGTIATINNALKITGIPIGVIFAATGRALLPYLATQATTKDMKAFKNTLRLYTWGIAVVTLCISVFMIVFSKLIVSILFQRGAFSEADVNLVAITLSGFAIGLFPMAIGFVFGQAFTALGKTRFLMYITLMSVLLNASFDAIFGSLWQSFGIAFATSLYYFCSMSVQIFILRKILGKLDLLKPPPEVLKVMKKISLGPYYAKWVAWQEQQSISWQEFYQHLLGWLFMLLIFTAGIAGTIINALMTLRIAFGSLLILAFLRYQYTLLLAWATINVFIGSALPFFNGNNLLSGFTLPTCLLLFYFPVKEALQRMVSLRFLLLFILWVLFSIWFSPIPLGTFFTKWAFLLDFLGVSVLTIMVINTQKRLLLLIDAMHLPVIFILIYGLWGYATHNTNAGLIDPTTGYRITSIFPDTPPGLALFLSMIMPLTIYRLTTLRWWYQKLAAIAILLLMLVVFGLTFSRGPLVIFPLCTFAIIPLLPKKKAKAIMISSCLLIGVLIIIANIALQIDIFARFANSDLGTLNGRTYLWQAILDHFDPTQLLGHGENASNTLLDTLQVGFKGSVIATVSHNLFLETMYDHGLIGVGLLILLFATQTVALLRQWYTTRNTQQRLFIALSLLICINIAIQCNQTNDLFNQQIGMTFFIAMALPFAECWMKQEETSEEFDKAKSEEKAIKLKMAQMQLSYR